MIPVANERGERLLAIRGDDAAAVVPVRFALVMATGPSGVLLVHNRRRDVWELPGGLVDAGESAAQCAARELLEESGQTATDLRWRALLELETPGPRIAYGALYCGVIPSPVPFTGGDEIDAIGFWPPTMLPAGVSAIDAALLDIDGGRGAVGAHCG